MEVRWLARLVPPTTLALVAGALALPGTVTGGTWDPPRCAASATPIASASGQVRGADGGAWFRMDPALGPDAALAGQRLTVGLVGRGETRILALPAESSASGPVGSVVAVTSDDGVASRVSLVDLAARCERVVGTASDVVRRAVLDPAGRSLVEARVDRATRADLGIWRRPLDGSPAVRVAPPLGADPRFGRTFSTELSWDVDGGTLVVESCGAFACRVRLVDLATGRVDLVANPSVGSVVGVSGRRIIAYEACRGLPCPVVSVDVTTGRTAPAAVASGAAALVASGVGTELVVQERAGSLTAIDLDRGARRHLAIPPALSLVPASSRSAAGQAVPTGWLLLTVDGRGITGSSPTAALVRAIDGRIARIPEVLR